MPKLDMNGASIELPPGFRCVSISCIAPPPGMAGQKAPTLQVADGFRDTFIIAAEPIKAGMTARAYHQAQMKMAEEGGLMVVKFEEFERNGLKGMKAEMVSEEEGLRQYQEIVVKGAEVWVGVGTSTDGPQWPEARARFEAAFASLSLA